MFDHYQYEYIFQILAKSEGIEKSEEVIGSLKYIIENNDLKVLPFITYQQEMIERYMSHQQEIDFQNSILREHVEYSTNIILLFCGLLIASAFINLFYIF